MGGAREARHSPPPTFPPPPPASPRQGLKTKHSKEKGKIQSISKNWSESGLTRAFVGGLECACNPERLSDHRPDLRYRAKDPSAHFPNDQIGMLS